MRAFLAELKRRNVLRVAGVYAVVGWAILQGVEVIFPILTLPPWTVTFVAALLLIGLPIAMIIAWAFELTPEGIRRTAAAPEAAPAPSGRGWLELALLVAILIVIGISVAQVLRREAPVVAAPEAADATSAPPVVAPPPASIAVLPFTSFSEDAESNYFADGLTEELINVLAQGGALKVTGRTSSFYFKGRNEDLREVGRRLGVAYVLEGSVRRAGERLRITAQLVSTSDGFHLWSQTYDRRLEDVLAIQDDVASSVGAVLEAKLVPQSEVEHGPENHRRFLIATGRLRDQGLESLTEARALFEDLMRREPGNPEVFAGYVRATAMLSGAYLTLDFETAMTDARKAVARALALAPDSVPALVAAGMLHTVIAHRSDSHPDLERAEAYLSRAVALAPDDPEALTIYGTLLNEIEEYGQAREVLERAAVLDPLAPVPQFELSIALQGLGRLADARSKLETLAAIYPEAVGAKLELAELLVAQGQFEAALPWLEAAHAARDTPRASYALAHLYVNVGLPERAERVLSEMDYAPLTAPLSALVRRNVANDDAEALALAQRELSATGDPIWRTVIVASALMVGDLDAARAQIREIVPGLLEDGATIERVEPNVVLFAANLLAREGRAVPAERLLTALLERYAPAAGGYDAVRSKLVRAAAQAQLGRRDAALAELRAAYLQGFRSLWDFDQFHRIDRLPTFASLRDDPAFAALLAEIEADNARTRARLLVDADTPVER